MTDFITAADFVDLIKSQDDLNILDIRTNIEYQAYHLDYPTTHIPLHEVNADKINSICAPNQPLYILCKAGPRAQKVSEFLTAQNIKNLIVIDGGILGCNDVHAPIKQEDTTITPDQIGTAIQESVQKFMIDNS